MGINEPSKRAFRSPLQEYHFRTKDAQSAIESLTGQLTPHGSCINTPIALEQRILLDAAGFETGETVLEEVASQDFDQWKNDPQISIRATDPYGDLQAIEESKPVTYEIAFIDKGIAGYEKIVQSIDDDISIVLIEPDENGLDKIASSLDGLSNIDGIHIISHGSSGALSLGNAVLDESTLQTSYHSQFAAIGDALSTQGDILIYACDFGTGPQGLRTVALLGDATGADIAASDDVTGDVQRGGDWDLEVRHGTIGIDHISASAFAGLLANAPVLDLDNDDSAASGINFETTYIENEPGVNIVDSDYTIVDPENNISELLVVLTDGQIGDRFDFPSILPGGITAGVSPEAVLSTPGRMTLSLIGEVTTTPNDWRSALGSITFLPSTNDVHNPNTADRNITVQVADDNNNTSAIASLLVHVVAENDQPNLDLDEDNSSGNFGGNYMGTYHENAAAAPAHSGTLTTDLDDTHLQSASATFTNPKADDQILIGGTVVSNGSTVTNAGGTVNGITYNVTSNASGQIVINFSGSRPIGDYETAIESISYENLSDDPNTEDRRIEFTTHDGQSSSPVRTATFNVIASNDSPEVIDPNTGNPPADPNAVVPDMSGRDGDPITSTNLSGYFTDPDHNIDTEVTFSAANLPDGLTLDPNTGILSGTPTSNASQGGDNPATSPGVYTVTLTATDPEGANASTQFAITVSNVGPIAQDDAATQDEKTVAALNVLNDNGNGADADGGNDNDTLSVSRVNGVTANVGQAVAGTNGGLFTVNSDGSASFDPNGEYQSLGVGQSTTTAITYQLTDGQGGFDDATITITVTGVNDKPEVIDPDTNNPPAGPNAIVPDMSGRDGDPITNTDLSIYFTDPDNDVATEITFSASNLPSGITINPNTGVLSGTPASDASQGGDDPAANPGVYTVTLTATDPSGASASTQFTFTARNVVPIAHDDAATQAENAQASINVFHDNGNGADTDGGNDRDQLIVSMVDGSVANVGHAVAGSNGGLFTIHSNGTATFNPNREFQSLAVGQSATSSISYELSDGQGGVDTATITITVTGLDEDPWLEIPEGPNDPIQNDARVADVISADPVILDALDGLVDGNEPALLNQLKTDGTVDGGFDRLMTLAGKTKIYSFVYNNQVYLSVVSPKNPDGWQSVRFDNSTDKWRNVPGGHVFVSSASQTGPVSHVELFNEKAGVLIVAKVKMENGTISVTPQSIMANSYAIRMQQLKLQRENRA